MAARKLTKRQADAALAAIRKQFADHVGAYADDPDSQPKLLRDWDGHDAVIIWESGAPWEWALNAFEPHRDGESGHRREGVARPAGLWAEPVNGFVLALYRDDSVSAQEPMTWAEIDKRDAEYLAARKARAAEEATKLKGMTAYIYRHALGNASNGGLSSRVDRVTLVGPGVPRISEPTADAPAVELAETVPGHTVARPAGQSGTWWMFGGAFVHSSDSRWPTKAPIPLHDRTESAEQYAALSS